MMSDEPSIEQHEPGPVLSRAAVLEVDRRAIEEFGIPGIVLMENAARAVAEVVLSRLDAPWRECRVGIACGRGNNGGDGWAIARHLVNEGVNVVITALGDPRPGSDAAINANIARQMHITEVAPDEEWGVVDLTVDALFGTGLDRPLEGVAAGLVDRLNAGAPIIAVDIPSGLDADSGQTHGPTIRAAVTVTLVALKPGLLQPEAAVYTGRVVVGDIGVPRSLITE